MQDLARSYNMIVCPGLTKFSVAPTKNSDVKSGGSDEIRTKNCHLWQVTSDRNIIFLKDLTVI